MISVKLPQLHRQFILLLLATATLIQIGCESEEISFEPQGDTILTSDQLVSASFYGRVIDDSGRAVADAEIKVGDITTYTDGAGDWYVYGATVKANEAYISLSSPSHFSASRTLMVQPESFNTVYLYPLRLDNPTLVDVASATEVVTASGARISFEADAFQYEDGRRVNGQARVYARHLDAADDAITLLMPGRLEGTRTDGSSTGLVTAGMIGVELRDAAGESLQLVDGKPAVIQVPVPANLQNPPPSIPLWHFDEVVGRWVEEGSASLEGNEYVGEVAHFTWWNIDIPGLTVQVCMQLRCDSTGGGGGQTFGRSTTSNGQRFFVSSTYQGRIATGTTDDNGKFCAYFFENTTFTFDVAYEACGGVVHSFDFTTGSTPLDLGVITFDCIEVSDSLTDCSNIWQSGGGAPPPPQEAPLTSVAVHFSTRTCEQGGDDVRLFFRGVGRRAGTALVVAPGFAGRLLVRLPRDSAITITARPARASGGSESFNVAFAPVLQLGEIDFDFNRIDVEPNVITGTVLDCDGARMSGTKVLLSNSLGTKLDSMYTDASGAYEFNISPCGTRQLTVYAGGDGIGQSTNFTAYEDMRLDPLTLCAADGDYYFRAELNGIPYTYGVCSGRAGPTGWSIYAHDDIDHAAPYFGLRGRQVAQGVGRFSVGSEMVFEQLRLGGRIYSSRDFPLVGTLEVHEWGQVTSASFEGEATSASGELLNLKLEIRFLKP